MSISRRSICTRAMNMVTEGDHAANLLVFCILIGVSSIVHADNDPKKQPPLPSLLQWEAQGARRDPIDSIDRHIGHIVGDLSDFKTDAPVQEKQKQVVGELDTIIKQIEEQLKAGGGSGSNPNPTKPMSKSMLAKGPGGSGPLHDPRAGGDKWGQLSPKQREQITQSQTEGFPPGYESVLASYYNRLAQEQVDNPATQPTKP